MIPLFHKKWNCQFHFSCQKQAEAGHFDKAEARIKKLANQSTEQLKIDKKRLTLEAQKLTLTIKKTFKIQAELNAESDAYSLVVLSIF